MKKNIFFPRKVFVKETEVSLKQKIEEEKKCENKLKGQDLKIFYDKEVCAETSARKLKDSKSLKKLRNIIEKSANKNSETTETITRTSVDLFRAAVANDGVVIMDCIEQRLDINQRDEFGWTALMTAAASKSEKAVEVLLRNGADKTVRDKGGNTALSIAHKKSCPEIIKLLEIKLEPEIEIKSEASSDEEEELETFFCDVCKATIRGVTVVRHKASTSHQLSLTEEGGNKSSIPTLYGIAETNKGFKMMINSGWDRDRPLGPASRDPEEGTSRKFPVKTTLKRDRLGLGSDGSAPKRVTHFGPNDPKAVENHRKERFERQTTLDKRKEAHNRMKDKRNEKRLRNMLSDL